MRGAHWALMLIALTCVSSRGRADSQALALEYDADATCPDQGAFSALVLEKLAANGVEESSSARPQIAAHIHAAGSGFVGQLALRRSDGSTYDREVTGASCSEVANALAFVLALALGAKEAAAPSPPVTVAPVAAPPPVPPSKPPATLSAPEQAPKPALAERRSPWRLGGGAQVGERTGLGRATLVGTGFLEVRRIAVSPLGFTFRAGFSSAQTTTLTVANATTDVSWWAGKLEACPLRLRILESLAFLPCAATDVGRQRATGRPRGPGSRSGTASKVWVDGLAAARLELSLARWLSVEAQGELIVPFTRYRFAFDPDTHVAYRAPLVATAALAGLTAHFP